MRCRSGVSGIKFVYNIHLRRVIEIGTEKLIGILIFATVKHKLQKTHWKVKVL